MGKKNKKIKLYTKKEREQKITSILLQIASMDLLNILSDEIKIILQNWIDTGNTIEKDIPLYQFDRIMIIRLYNDKKKTTFINLKYNKKQENIIKENNNKNSDFNEIEKILENGNLEELEELEKILEK